MKRIAKVLSLGLLLTNTLATLQAGLSRGPGSGPVLNNPVVPHATQPPVAKPIAVDPSKIPSPSTYVVATISAPATIGTDVAAAMLLQKTNDTNDILQLATSGVAALTSAYHLSQEAMNSTKNKAINDVNIGQDSVKQSHLAILTSLVETGTKNLQSIADQYNAQISTDSMTGINNLDLLAGQNANNISIATSYSNFLTQQSLSAKGQINSALQTNTKLLNDLEATITTAIQSAVSMPATPPANGGGSSSAAKSWGNDVVKDLLEGVLATVGGAATTIGVFYGKTILCKFGVGTCPPIDAEAQALIKKFSLPDNVDELLTRVNCGKISDLLNRSASLVKNIKQNLKEKLGLNEDFFNKLTSPKDLNDFLDNMAKVREQIESAVSGLDPKEVVSKIGDVLKENPELVDALKSGNITEVVAQVRSKMGAATSGAVVEPETGDSPASSAPSNAGAGPSVGGGASNAGQSAFSDLVASNGNLARQLVANIRSQNLDEAAFRLQFKQFNDRIASLQSQPDANQLEIEELKAQSAAAKEILDNPVANGDPFDTIEL